MFDTVPGGLPLHPLVIHVVVLAIPLTLALALLFAIPRTRDWARWPLAVVSAGSAVSTFVAVEAGEALATVLRIFEQDSPVRELITEHQELAEQLLWMTVVMAVLGVATAFGVGRRPRSDRTAARRGVEGALTVALILVAALASFWTYRVGDIGSEAVWNPSGTQTYQLGG